MRIANREDFGAGILFIAVAAVGLWVAADYPVGSTLRMGPGYVPRLLFILLLGLGALIAARGVAFEGETGGDWAWRPLIVIPGALVLFGLALERLGLAVATLALVVAATRSWRDYPLIEALLLAIGLTLFATSVFIWGLRLNIPLWPA